MCFEHEPSTIRIFQNFSFVLIISNFHLISVFLLQFNHTMHSCRSFHRMLASIFGNKKKIPCSGLNGIYFSYAFPLSLFGIVLDNSVKIISTKQELGIFFLH